MGYDFAMTSLLRRANEATPPIMEQELHSGKAATADGEQTSPHCRSGYIAERSEIAMKKTELKELYEMMFPNYPDILTVTELREILGISRHLAYKLLGDGYITAVKIGSAYKIPKARYEKDAFPRSAALLRLASACKRCTAETDSGVAVAFVF